MPCLETHYTPKYMGCNMQSRAIFDYKGKLGLGLYGTIMGGNVRMYLPVLGRADAIGNLHRCFPSSARVIGKQLRGRFGFFGSL